MTLPKIVRELAAKAPAPPKDMLREIEKLRAMTAAELVPRYTELYGKPPRVKHRAYLWRRCAWKLQEMRSGGLSEKAKARLEELISQLDLPWAERGTTASGAVRKGEKRVTAAPSVPSGEVYEREWHGQTIRVVVTSTGFECRGVVYKSLTAVAKAVTGAHWNGKFFFGITKRSLKGNKS